DATSILNMTLNGATAVTVTASAVGGSAGNVLNINGGAGGNALASAALTSNGNLSVNANSAAVGHGGSISSGSASGALDGFMTGAGGNALANASAMGTGTIALHSAVTATATARGQSGGNFIDSETVRGNGGNG